MAMPLEQTYAIYDTKQQDELLGMFTSIDAAEHLNCSLQTLYSNVCRKRLFQKRYEVVNVLGKKAMNQQK